MTSSTVTTIQDNTQPHSSGCNNKDETGKVCRDEQKIVHCEVKTVSTSNLIQHIEKTWKRCASHASVDVLLKNASPNHVTVNDPDTLTNSVSIMVNKHLYKSSLKDIMDKYYEMFRGRNHTNKTDFFNRTEDSDGDMD
jgi:hypothetical protein